MIFLIIKLIHTINKIWLRNIIIYIIIYLLSIYLDIKYSFYYKNINLHKLDIEKIIFNMYHIINIYSYI